ncbi:MAG: serine--tRNA ligase, partial [Oscillospiraceae bacterium]|nr:serine--tRNA ligase [Oscillospiraceae bacterium]
MLDIRKIKENPEEVKRLLRAKEVDCDEAVDKILELDRKRRELIASTETKKAEQNKVSKQIPILKKAGEDVAPIFKQMGELKAQIAENDKALTDVEAEYRTWMLSLPNLPDPDLKPGGKENNEPLRYYGKPHEFDFEPKHHVDLCTDLGLIDYERGAKLAGTGFWIYTGMGARLEWALLNYFMDCHLHDGYEMVILPHMLEYQCGETAGQFPKFADEVYKIA